MGLAVPFRHKRSHEPAGSSAGAQGAGPVRGAKRGIEAEVCAEKIRALLDTTPPTDLTQHPAHRAGVEAAAAIVDDTQVDSASASERLTLDGAAEAIRATTPPAGVTPSTEQVWRKDQKLDWYRARTEHCSFLVRPASRSTDDEEANAQRGELAVCFDPATYFGRVSLLSNHVTVCDAVYAGDVQVGASFTNADGDVSVMTLDACLPSLGDKAEDLRVIFASEPIPNDVVVVRAGFPQALSDKLAAALDALATSESGRKVLADAFASDGFVPAHDSSFGVVRQAIELLPAEAQ